MNKVSRALPENPVIQVQQGQLVPQDLQDPLVRLVRLVRQVQPALVQQVRLGQLAPLAQRVRQAQPARRAQPALPVLPANRASKVNKGFKVSRALLEYLAILVNPVIPVQLDLQDPLVRPDRQVPQV